MPWASGTTISHRLRTKRCATYSRAARTQVAPPQAQNRARRHPKEIDTMPSVTDPKLIEVLSETLHPLTGDPEDYDRIMDLVGDADWPDAYRLNRYVRRLSDDVDAIEALADFKRFRPGCGATPLSSNSSNGCAPATTRSRPTVLKSVFMASISTASAPRWKPCSATLKKSIPKPRGKRALATPASINSVRTLKPMAF